MEKQKDIIGSNTFVDVEGIEHIPAKIDTGADSSAIWATNLKIDKDGFLHFNLFGPESPFYTGQEFKRKNYKVVVTRSSHGNEKIFYRTSLRLKINGRRIKALFTLADRSRNNFPILIGKRTLTDKFIVDVSQHVVNMSKTPKTSALNYELRQDPYRFHQKYFRQTVENYYFQQFDQLSDQHQFHFATRMKNGAKLMKYQRYIDQYQLSQDLQAVFDNNDFSKVNYYQIRRPYFEKYNNLFAIEALLFRVNHLLNEYDIDLRSKFKTIYPVNKLYDLADQLLDDEGAIAALSTYAANVICLTETLFPRNQDVISELSRRVLQLPADSEPYVYLCTHIVLCASVFYTQPVPTKYFSIFEQLLTKSAKYVLDHFETVPLDIKLELLVCMRMIGQTNQELHQLIKDECRDVLQNSPFLVDYRKAPRSNTLNGAEHRNALFIMSGLDSEIAAQDNRATF